jgi:hypothetical protein
MEPIAGPSGLDDKKIDNLSRSVKKIHVRAKYNQERKKGGVKKKVLLKKGRWHLKKWQYTSAGESLVVKRRHKTGKTSSGSIRPAKIAKNSGTMKKKYSDAVSDSLRVAVVKKRDDVVMRTWHKRWSTSRMGLCKHFMG